ncbi:MAG: molybdate transport system substrate-binding protein [Myxococcota bacterium]|jgi:molybdate transport system substrate-binding protein
MLLLALACQPTGTDTTLNVLAASSLTETVAALEVAFETTHPGIDVRTRVAGSQTLRLQIEQGAAADVFLSANQEHMVALKEAGHIATSTVFAHNTLALIVPADNPAGITAFADLPRAQRLVLGATTVPIGQYTAALLRRADAEYEPGFSEAVEAAVVSREHSVRLARARVVLGEADAAIVYRTDTDTDGIIEMPIPTALNLTASYHLGLTGSASPTAALWVDFLSSEAGCEVLSAHRFIVDPCGD